MGAVQKIVSIGMDKALTLSRPENQCTREKPKQQARVYFTCGDPQQREDRRLPVPRLRHGRLQPQNGAADFLFHSIVHSKSSRSLSESVFLAA